MLLDSSIAFLNAVKKGRSSETVRILNLLESYSLKDVEIDLNTDKEKLIFWVNIYNAFFQLRAKEKRVVLETNRGKFFTSKQVHLFGLYLSFDDVENRVLRRSRWKFGMGYVAKVYPKKWERILRVKQFDFRIHFLLNCGAESCPVIHPLTAGNFEEELKRATSSYLNDEVKVNESDKKIVLNQLFLFYLGDFGGKKGLKKILFDHHIIKRDHMDFKWKFTEFNKSLKLNNFVQEKVH